MFTKKTIRDIDLEGKRVLMRADYNVPVENGRVTSDYRITESLPTIKALLEKNVRLVIMSHLGRPEGKRDLAFTLKPVAVRLEELLGREVQFAPDCIGAETEAMVQALQPGEVLLLENVRFHPGEEANDEEFAKKLASYGDVFVQDAFGVVHHGAVSVSELPKYMPSAAGLLLEREVDTITKVMSNPERPLAAIIGGAKIADKIEILNKLIEMADFVAIGGAMANTFLAAKGLKIGKSKYDPDELDMAREVMAKAEEKSRAARFTFYLPHDGIVTTKIDKSAPTRLVDWDAAFISEAQNYPKKVPASAHTIADDEMLVDVGPLSAAFMAGGVQLARTVIWNGTLGITEVPALHGPVGPYARGTELLIDALTGEFGSRPFVVVGGGDTTGYIEQRGLTKAFNHVSTGGGASLELMAGRALPGVEALEDK